MAITPNFDVNDLKRKIQDNAEKIKKAMILYFEVVGEKFVKNAREKTNNKEYREAINSLAYGRNERRAALEPETPSFTDRTGNLRASIGYAIYDNGIRVGTGFEDNVGGLTAEVVSGIIASNFPEGLVLIVVAGMEYAAAVEAKGYDVITGSSILAEADLKQAMKDLGDLIPQMK